MPRDRHGVFRMYNEQPIDDPPPRPNRISFYVFNPLAVKAEGVTLKSQSSSESGCYVVGTSDGERYGYLQEQRI
jgi:hypothetical protein